MKMKDYMMSQEFSDTDDTVARLVEQLADLSRDLTLLTARVNQLEHQVCSMPAEGTKESKP